MKRAIKMKQANKEMEKVSKTIKKVKAKDLLVSIKLGGTKQTISLKKAKKLMKEKGFSKSVISMADSKLKLGKKYSDNKVTIKPAKKETKKQKIKKPLQVKKQANKETKKQKGIITPIENKQAKKQAKKPLKLNKTKTTDYPIIHRGDPSLFEADHYRVGDIINVVEVPKRVKLDKGDHVIVPAPGKYLNTIAGVFVNDKKGKPVYLQFMYFKTTPRTTRED